MVKLAVKTKRDEPVVLPVLSAGRVCVEGMHSSCVL